jgi:putative transposase
VFSEREIAELLGIARTAMQRSHSKLVCSCEASDIHLLPIVIEIFQYHRRRYGKRRIVADLAKRGIHCGHERIAKLMKILNLLTIQPKSFKPGTTESRYRLGYNENLLLHHPEPSAIDQIWVGDITYIPIAGHRFVYLSTLMDRYSRRIVGWTFGLDMGEHWVVDSLRKAIASRQPSSELIHHTDRGGQYAGGTYREILKRAAILQSMSRAGDCYDNAFMESFYGTIKTELQMTEYKTCEEMIRELTDFINYYNFERLHSSIRYLSPSHFEATVLQLK